MVEQTRNVVVFDLGGVLIDWNPRYLYRQLFEDEEQMEWFLANICTPEWNHKHDAGRPFAEGVAEAVAAFPDHEDLIRVYHARWEEMIAGPIEETVEILAELRRMQHPLYALTNWSAETFPTARRMFPFLDWFDGVVVSGEVCLAKPDPGIFRHLLDTHEIDAGASVFIDDVPANVAAARALGFHGLLFESPSRLREELVSLGFLPASS